MGKLIKVDFSPEGKYLRELTKKLRAEKKGLTLNQKVFHCLLTQNPELQLHRNVV